MRSVQPTDQQIEAEWGLLSLEDREAVLDANLAADILATRPDRHYWRRVGIGMSRLRQQAIHRSGANHPQDPKYRDIFRTLLRRVPGLEAIWVKDKSAANKALEMAERWPEVEAWLAALAQSGKVGAKRESSLNHPNAIMRAFEAADAAPRDKDGKPAASGLKAEVARLQEELDVVKRENERLKKAHDNVSEGSDWTWLDDVETIAQVWLRLQPTKAARIASKVLELAKGTARRTGRKRNREPAAERHWDDP